MWQNNAFINNTGKLGFDIRKRFVVVVRAISWFSFGTLQNTNKVGMNRNVMIHSLNMSGGWVPHELIVGITRIYSLLTIAIRL